MRGVTLVVLLETQVGKNFEFVNIRSDNDCNDKLLNAERKTSF